MPLSQDATTRASSARCYLTTQVRGRPNLAVMAWTRVTDAGVAHLREPGLKIVPYRVVGVRSVDVQ